MKYYPPSVDRICDKIAGYRSDGKKVFATSSFQTHSIPLLHIISSVHPAIPIYFIDTGYHFAETIEYKNRITDLLGLTVIDLKPELPKTAQIGQDGKFLFTSDPDYCCYLNKVLPLRLTLPRYDVWISGVRAEQTPTRSKMTEEQLAESTLIKYHPLIQWTAKDIDNYRNENGLPPHPLQNQGYHSIGCQPCTIPVSHNCPIRDSRWFGLSKTECGLQTDLLRNII